MGDSIAPQVEGWQTGPPGSAFPPPPLPPPTGHLQAWQFDSMSFFTFAKQEIIGHTAPTALAWPQSKEIRTLLGVGD